LTQPPRAEAINTLRQQQLYPTQVAQEGKGRCQCHQKTRQNRSPSQAAKGKVAKASGANAKVKSKTLMVFTRQLATLIDSGLAPPSWLDRAQRARSPIRS
jgi:type IV pilus assembly protein PilC